MKNKIIGGVFISILSLFIIYPSHAILIDFEPTSQDVILGETAAVSIVIEGLGDQMSISISTFDLIVMFDPAILSLNLINVVYGDPVIGDQLDYNDPFSPWTITDTKLIEDNKVNLFELSFDNGLLDSSQAGAFTLATLNFDTIGLGTSDLALLPPLEGVAPLGDAFGGPLYPELGSATITVNPVPEPATILLLTAGMFGIGAFSRKKFRKSKA